MEDNNQNVNETTENIEATEKVEANGNVGTAENVVTNENVETTEPKNENIKEAEVVNNNTYNGGQVQSQDSSKTLAIIGFVCSIVGVFFLRFILGIVGLVLGIMALRNANDDKTTKGLSIAGIIIAAIDIIVLPIFSFISSLLFAFI